VLGAEEMSNEEIVEELMLQPSSVRRNASCILAKLHLRDRVQITVAWYKNDD
jgi:two component transcriptional regulator, luxR family protein